MEILNSFVQSIVTSVGPFLPRLVGALVILLVAWIVARLVKAALSKGGARLGLDNRLKSPGLSHTFAEAGYWLVWLVALPILLGALGLTAMLDPINGLLAKILSAIPSVLSAAVILGIGWLVARIVRQVVTNLLTAAGSERLAARLGMKDSLGKDGLAGVVGLFLFILILLPVLAAALQPLGLDSVTRPVSNMLDTILALLPKLLAAVIIVVIAAIIGRMVSNLIASVLSGLGFNGLLPRLGLGSTPHIAGRTPSELVGTLVFIGIMLAAVTQASEVVGFQVLTSAIGEIGVIAAQVGAGLLVLAIGLWLANIAANAIKGSTIVNRDTLATAARVAILFLVVPLALRQAGLPSEIVTIGFGALIGALTIAAAIAFGIGGRHAAARMLDRMTNAMDQVEPPKQ